MQRESQLCLGTGQRWRTEPIVSRRRCTVLSVVRSWPQVGITQLRLGVTRQRDETIHSPKQPQFAAPLSRGLVAIGRRGESKKLPVYFLQCPTFEFSSFSLKYLFSPVLSLVLTLSAGIWIRIGYDGDLWVRFSASVGTTGLRICNPGSFAGSE